MKGEMRLSGKGFRSTLSVTDNFQDTVVPLNILRIQRLVKNILQILKKVLIP